MWREYKISFRSSFIFIIMYVFIMIMFSGDAYAENVISGTGMDYIVEHSINATLYDTNQYGGGGSGQTLTAEGINVENWNYNDSKYLQVNIMVVAKQDEVHVVEIKLPTPFYSVSDVTDVPAGYSRVEMTKNPNLPTNGGRGTYYVNKGSGTLRYYLKPNMTRATIRLELRYDEILWDKLGYSPLTPEGVSPIMVSLGHEQSCDNSLLGQYSSMVHVAKATSGARVMSYGNNYLKRNWNTTYWDGMNEYFGYMGDPVRLWLFSTENNRQYIYKYYKRVTIDVDVPYYERDGKKYYMDYDKENLVFENTANGWVKGTATETSESHITFYLDGYYMGDDTGIDIDFKWPEGLTTDENQLAFTGGRTWYKVISNANTEVVGFTQSIGKITLATKKYEKVSVYDPGQSVAVSKMPNNSITKLGCVFLRNSGTGTSTEKKLDIQFNKKHLVTYMRLPADLETKEYKVKYTLKDKDGEDVVLGGKKSWTIDIKNGYYNTNTIDNMCVTISRSMLPKKQRKYYLNTISYKLAGINKRVNLNRDGDDIYGRYCAGYFFGKLASSVVAGEKLNGTLTITSPKDSGISTYVHKINSTAVSDETVSYWVRDVKFSKSELKAGKVVYTTGSLCVSDVWYIASSTWLHNMRFALLLPNGVSVDRSSIDVRTSVGNKVVDVVDMTKKKVDEFNTLWIIDLNKDVYIGYMNEDLGPLSTNGDRLYYSVKLITDSDMEAASIHTDKMVYFAGINQHNVIDVCRKSYKTTDKWDLNENGKTNDYIACVSVSDRNSCSIAANPVALEIKDSIDVLGGGSANNGDALMNNVNDIIQYELSIASINDGEASSFEYYIPIMKKSASSDDFLVTSSVDRAFNLQLLEEATITGDDIYIIEYAIKESLSYKQARILGESEWYTSKELEDVGKSYRDVTLIRITVKGGVIKKGMDTTIGVKMMYQGDDIYIDKGKYNAWRGCGYYDYDDGLRFVSGHFPTGGVSATINVTEPPKNNINIDSGDQIEGGRMFCLYDVNGYTESKISEPIEFRVDRNKDSDIVTFAISLSDEYMDTDSYVDKKYINITDENGCKVEANSDNLYILKANCTYFMSVNEKAFQVDKDAREYLYAHSYYAPLSAMEKIILVRVSAFEQY